MENIDLFVGLTLSVSLALLDALIFFVASETFGD